MTAGSGRDYSRSATTLVSAMDASGVQRLVYTTSAGVPTGRLDVSPRYRSEHANSVTRRDLARFILDEVTSPQWVQGTPTLGTAHP